LKANPSTFAMPREARVLWDNVAGLFDAMNIDLQDLLLKNLDELSAFLSHLATTVIRDTFFVAFNLIVLAFTLFFFLRDGPSIIRRVVELLPMSPDHKQVILERIQDTLYAVIRGVLVIAAVQGFLTGV